ncbi:MAG TPA: HNH endonuclease [Methanosarcina sp.]|nr:HNH endonuclease [Methanosarcina sp.]
MTKKTYWEKLKDPRWQKLRLEAMQEKDFCCEVCGDKKSELNVHHKEYFKGYEPWEYELNQLAVLCSDCHSGFHDSFDELKWICSLAELDGPKGRKDASVILAGFLNIDYEGYLCITGLQDMEHHRKLYKAGYDAYDFVNIIEKN